MKICYSCFGEMPGKAKTCPRCGSSVDLRNEDKYPHALPCGTVLNGRYVVGRVLGQGGFGITYAGQEFKSKKLVAIKEYYPENLATREDSRAVVPFNTNRAGDFEYGKRQFLHEAQTLSAFIGSPNIVRVFSYFEENGTAYFIMEYVRGKNLKQYVEERGGRISWEETWNLMMPVLDALSEVHFRKIIHRDIKPENIILTRDRKAKLIDFGAARYSYGEKSQSLTAILTPGYAPPEQYYSKGEQGSWTDVYALAATIYFCITGINPPVSVERMLEDCLVKPSALGVPLPDYTETALLKGLALRTDDRFQTIYDFRNAVLANMDPIGGNTADAIEPSPNPYETTIKETQKKVADGDFPGSKGVKTDNIDNLQFTQNPERGGKSQSASSSEEENGSGKSSSSPKKGNGSSQSVSSTEKRNGSDRTPSQMNKGLLGLVLIAAAAFVVVMIAKANLFGENSNAGGSGAGDSRLQADVTGNSDGSDNPVSQGENIEGTEGKTGQEDEQEKGLEYTEENAVPDEPSPHIDSIDAGDTVKETPTPDPPTVARDSDEPMALTDTWEEIISASKDGTYKNRYRIGDTKELDMGMEGVITMKLVAMDEDDLADGSGKAPMTWVADELLKTAHNMNSTDTTEGAWTKSEMRSWLQDEILPFMPEEVKNSIRKVTKYSYSKEEEKAVMSEDTIWIPSSREMFLAESKDSVEKFYEKEGAAYTEIFKDDESRVRSRAGASSASWWWLRSVNINDSRDFNYVDSKGSSYGSYASGAGGVLIGFCL